MEIIYLEELKKIRGYNSVVRGDKDIEEVMVSRYKRTGDKVVSFYDTRNDVIDSYNSYEDICGFIESCLLIDDKMIDIKTLNVLQRSMIEKIIRDYVPLSSVSQIRKATIVLYNNSNNNTRNLAYELERYVKSNKPKFSTIIREADKIISSKENTCIA